MSDGTPVPPSGEEPDAAARSSARPGPLHPGAAEPASAKQLADVGERMTGFERATLRWAKIAVLMSGLAALFVCAQWYEMHAGARDTHDLALASKGQSDKIGNISDAADRIRQAADNMVLQEERIADNAKDSLDASNRQSKEALSATIAQSKASLDTTIRNAQDGERAWLTPSGFKLSEEPTLNKGVSVAVTMSNTGRTPSLNLVNQSQLSSWSGQPPRIEFILPPNPISRGILAPGNTNATFATEPLTFLTDVQLAAYTSKTNNIYIEALIRYDDIFDRPHWTRLCAFHVYGAPLDSFQFCKDGNEMDRPGHSDPNEETDRVPQAR